MTDVASLKLCQQLWELSGWETSDWYDLDPDGKPEEYLATTEDKIDENNYIPAYSLGYLITKLPKTAKHPATGDEHTIGFSWHIAKKKWVADYQWSMLPNAIAEDLSDAVCKLAIELFKQGILTRSTKNG